MRLERYLYIFEEKMDGKMNEIPNYELCLPAVAGAKEGMVNREK